MEEKRKPESKTEPKSSEESNEKPEEESKQESEDDNTNKESKENVEKEPEEKLVTKLESEKESKLEDIKSKTKAKPENSEELNEKLAEESKQESEDKNITKESKQKVEKEPQGKVETKSESKKTELKSAKESKLEGKEEDNSVNNEIAAQTDITLMGHTDGITITTQTSVACGLDLTDEEVVKILSIDYSHHSHHSILLESSKLGSFNLNDKSLSKDKIEERLNEYNTPIDKNLLSIMSTAIRNLSNELLNLKSLYNKCLPDEQFKDKKKEEIIELEEDIINRYEIDLCTVDALDFPLSVAKDDAFADNAKFKVPARNIKDFDVNLDEDIKECQPMFDYDLDAYQESDRSIFNANPNLSYKDKNAVFPMFDTSLKGGTISPQIGLTRRKDITIFLEEYVQHIMTDADLLIKPPKEECSTKNKPLDSKPQWDTDIGKHTAQLNSDLMEKLYTCRCNKRGNQKDCSCGCQNPKDASESDTSDTEEDCNFLTMERAMFDFDLTGRLIKKPRRRKISSTYTGTKAMLDTDLLQEIEKYNCKCNDIKDPNCECSCQGKETILCEEVSTEDVLMYDYNLNGYLIKKPDSFSNIDSIKRFKGVRGMFDVDLKFVIDPKKTIVGKCCICHEALRPDCLCGCSPEDVVPTCACVGESLPRPMWDVDLRIRKDLSDSPIIPSLKQDTIQSVNPNESITCQELKSTEDEEDDDFKCQVEEISKL